MNRFLIHVEKVWDDGVWENLLKFLKDRFGHSRCYLFLMSPQFEYQRAVLGYRGTELELKKILKQRYKELKSLQEVYGFRIGLHIHICLNPKELSITEKERVFFNSCKFLKEVIKDIDGIAFGWFKYDSYLEDLCRLNKLPILHSGISFHDYDLPISKFKLIEHWIRDKLRKVLR